MQPTEKDLYNLLIRVTRAAWAVCDGTEENDHGLVVHPDDFKELSAALDEIDKLPDPPNVLAEAGAKVEYWLGQLAQDNELIRAAHDVAVANSANVEALRKENEALAAQLFREMV